MKAPITQARFRDWLANYRRRNADLLRDDRTFAAWFEDQYTPIAGGWQY